jgi:hypothetical protein
VTANFHFAKSGLDEAVISHTFTGWRIDQMQRAAVPSDTRMLEVIVARLSTR